MLERVPPLTFTSRRAIALYALLSVSTAYADSPTLESPEQVQTFTDSVVQAAVTDEAEAFTLLKAHTLAAKDFSTIPGADLEAIAARYQTSAAQRLTVMGKPTGTVEFLGKKEVGDNLLRMSYLEHRLRLPTLWTFDFYRTAGGWTLTGFNADSNFSELLGK